MAIRFPYHNLCGGSLTTMDRDTFISEVKDWVLSSML